MKKTISALLAVTSLYGMPSVLAEPLAVSGDVSVKYERDRADGDSGHSGTMSTLRLTAEKDLGEGWSMYLRLGAQHATDPGLADYIADGSVYAQDKKTVGAFDLFGLKYKNGNMEYKIGRQDLAIGSTALLYSRSDSNIGKHNFVDGITASGKTGILDLTAAAVREDNAGSADNRLYAVRAGYSPNETVNYGITLGRYQYKDRTAADANTNHVALDGAYTFGRNKLSAELAKSNRSDDNKAYAATWNYDFNGKTAAYITGFRVEANGDMGGQSDFDNDNRGIYYGITHQLSKANSLEMVYKKQKTISGGQDNSKLEATVTYSF